MDERTKKRVVTGAHPVTEGTHVQPRIESDLVLNGATGGRLPPGPRMPGTQQTLRWMYRPIDFMEQCRRRYGPIFSLSLGPADNVFVIADPAAAKQVLTADPEYFRAGDTNGIFRDVVGNHSILVMDGPEHLHHRRILLPVVGRHAERYRELIAGIARDRVATWEPGSEIRLLGEMEAISFEVMMRIAIGTDGSSDREDKLRTLIPQMMDRCESPFTLIPWFRHEMGGISPYARLMKFIDGIDEILYEMIAERRSDPLTEIRDDALSLLIQATYEDGTPLEDNVIRDELLTMLMAGYETTTAGLTWAFERLLRSPDKLDRLTSELETGDQSYLMAVVKEALRRRPVIPIAARKALVPIDLMGYSLPAGSVLMVAIYLIHSDPELYPEPKEFRPERFLEADPKGMEGGAWIPFGGGIRRCLGASLAQYELAVVIRTVLEEAELELVDEADEPVARRRFTLSPGREGQVRVRRISPGVKSPAGSRRFSTPKPIKISQAEVPD
jgi:cytochrome P450 family 135